MICFLPKFSAGLNNELRDAQMKLETAATKKDNLKAKLETASAEQDKLLQALGDSQQIVLKISNDFSELNKKVPIYTISTLQLENISYLLLM